MLDEITNQQIYTHNYLYILGASILYYDYFLTFSDEVKYVWGHPVRLHWMFYVNRYFSILADLAVSVSTFLPFSSFKACRTYSTFRELMLVIAQIFVGVILGWRTYALYGRSKPIAALLFTVAGAVVALGIWSVLTQEPGPANITMGCQFTETAASGIRIAGGWEGLMMFDLVIFLLTLLKTLQTRRETFVDESYDRGRFDSVVELILRDGAIYFAVMGCANVTNAITFYALPLELQGGVSTFSSSLSVTLTSRLMLNLRKEALLSIHGSAFTETDARLTMYTVATDDNASTMIYGQQFVHQDTPLSTLSTQPDSLRPHVKSEILSCCCCYNDHFVLVYKSEDLEISHLLSTAEITVKSECRELYGCGGVTRPKCYPSSSNYAFRNQSWYILALQIS
ncbi:hypothetical protein ABKN59_008691 [Abortiporus biennis]